MFTFFKTRAPLIEPTTKPVANSSERPHVTVIPPAPVERIKTGVLVVGVFADGTLTAAARRLDLASKGRITTIVASGDLQEDVGASLLVHEMPGVAAERILLVRLGPQNAIADKAFRAALRATAARLAGGAARTAVVTLADLDVPGRSLAWRLQQASCLLVDGAYQVHRVGTNAPASTNGSHGAIGRGARAIALRVGCNPPADLERAVRRGQAIAEGIALAKDLGNLPGNVCHPPYLADAARALGAEFSFDVQVLERADMMRLGMGAALSVGQASDRACKFIVMHYQGAQPAARPIVLVGKGVTFDTGGISLKPGANMDEMKFDMCGAASVYGAVKIAARLGLPLNVVGIVPAAENMPGGNASRPGDVVTSMSGQTIEILNTDAEGRLGLCDALTYAERFNPECVVDIATLTGACVIALGDVASGLLANDDALAGELLASGREADDRAWQLPLWDEYAGQLTSRFADVSNLGGRAAGTITAGCFLARFAKAYKWAHLDIAGTSSLSGDAKGATGRPVPLLADFLIGRAEQATPARPA
jgi:leucyl aminopeptidase